MAEYSLAGKRVWVCGHKGMVGSAIVRRLESEDCEVLVADRAESTDLAAADGGAVLVAAKRRLEELIHPERGQGEEDRLPMLRMTQVGDDVF